MLGADVYEGRVISTVVVYTDVYARFSNRIQPGRPYVRGSVVVAPQTSTRTQFRRLPRVAQSCFVEPSQKPVSVPEPRLRAINFCSSGFCSADSAGVIPVAAVFRPIRRQAYHDLLTPNPDVSFRVLIPDIFFSLCEMIG